MGRGTLCNINNISACDFVMIDNLPEVVVVVREPWKYKASISIFVNIFNAVLQSLFVRTRETPTGLLKLNRFVVISLEGIFDFVRPTRCFKTIMSFCK